MMRILLFLATNAAVLVLISIVFQVLGIEGILAENGVDLNLQALLVMSAVIGFGGSFISLALSKFMAKRSMGVQLIEQPRNQTEQWLVSTVQRQAEEAGIGEIRTPPMLIAMLSGGQLANSTSGSLITLKALA